MTNSILRSLSTRSVSFLALSAGVISGPALAQETQAPSGADSGYTTGEIIVTAQKRSERMQDVPMGISVVSSDAMVRQNLNTLKDVLTRVPGVIFQETAPGLKRVAIRGVNASSGNPLVGFTIDDVPVGSSTFIGFGSQLSLDLDPTTISRVEILKGPQGTLYGASTMGGLIKYETVTPSYTDTSGSAQVEGNVASHGDVGFNVRASASTPLATDRFAVQISGFYRRDPGFIDDVTQGLKDVNDLRVYGGRLALVGDLTDTLTMKASAIYQHSSAGGTSTQDNSLAIEPAYGNYKHARLPGTDIFTAKTQFYNLVLEQDLGAVTLMSLTGYNRLDYVGTRDLSVLYGGFGPAFYDRTDLGQAFTNKVRNKKFSQEVRLASTGDGPLSFIVGGFYTHEKSLLAQHIFPVDGTTGEPISDVVSLLRSDIPTTYEEIAAFLNVTYKFSEMFDIQFGGRLSHNNQTLTEFDSGYLTTGSNDIDSFSVDSKETPFTYSIAPRLHLNPDLMIYGRLSTGYRAGGPNPSPPGSVPREFESDKTKNYELGVKGTLFDRKLSLDLAVFQIDWDNIQTRISDPDTGLQYYTNVGKVRSKGVEGSVTVKAAPGLDLSLNATYVDAKIIEADSSASYVLAGFRLPYVAKFSGSASIDYSWQMASAEPYIGATVSYLGKREVDFVSRSTRPRVALPDFTTVDLRAGAKLGQFDLALYIKNVGDVRGYVGSSPIANTGPFAMTLISPRTFGVSLGVGF